MAKRASWRYRFTTWITPGKWVVIATTANILSTGIFVFASVNAGNEARQHNCRQVAAAFEAYTDALAEATGAAEHAVLEFRHSYEPALRECR